MNHAKNNMSLVFVCVLLTAVCVGKSLARKPCLRKKAKQPLYIFPKPGIHAQPVKCWQKQSPADLFELKIAKPPAAKGQLPEIEPARIDLKPYSSVVVASPVWAANLVPAVRAFLKNNSLGGKKCRCAYNDQCGNA